LADPLHAPRDASRLRALIVVRGRPAKSSRGRGRVERCTKYWRSLVEGVVCLLVLAAPVVRAAEPDSRLIEAIKSGNREMIRTLLRQPIDVNAREADGTTALHWAVRSDDLATVDLLIRARANVNAANRYSLTPIALSAANGSAAVTAALLDAGADPNAVTPGGETVLMTAARTGNAETVRLLLDRGADVTPREHSFGETALMWAAGENHPDIVRLLVARGADVDATAAVLEFPRVKVDAATMVITALPRGGLTALMYAARQGSLEAARALIDAGARLNVTDPDGMSATVIAIINAHYDVAALLVERGADPEVADTSGMAALYALVDMHTLDPMVNRPPPRPTGQVSAMTLANMLLAHHANANAALKAPLLPRQHNFGDAALGAGATPLMRAAKNGDVELMRLLVAGGADPNRRTRVGMTPLLFAMGPGRRKSAKDALEAVAVCVSAGADVNAVNDAGETPMHAAALQNDQIVRFLAEHGAKVDVRDKNGRTPLDVANGVGGGAGSGQRGGRGRGGTAAVREATAALLRELMKQQGVSAAPAPQ
jgi:ankyrin repeat protein